MLTQPPPPTPDDVNVLVVGALTIDHFADGAETAGGSVLHAARGLWLDGRSVGVVTLAGDEPAARAGLRELAEIAEVAAEPARQTAAFAHLDRPVGRQLQLRAPADLLSRGPMAGRPRAVLYAPVADELGPSLGGQQFDGVPSGAILQGWLRRLVPGEAIHPLPLAELAEPIRLRLAQCDLLAASTEDLTAEAPTPAAQLAALRGTFGPGPLLLLTGGSEGAWLQEPTGALHRIRPPRIVEGVPDVGAGDAFAALLLDGLARGIAPVAAATDAAGVTAEMLAERSTRVVHVVGDVHGMADELGALLRQIGLTDASGSWSGGRDELWLTGDLVDRGPDGIGVLDLLLRLAREAAAAGGRVASVLGNHEVLLLAAREMPDALSGGPGGTMRDDWLYNGGRESDLDRLTDEHADWIRSLPVAARVAAALIVHADAPFYTQLAAGVTSAVAQVRDILAVPRPDAWDALLAAFSGRRAFAEDPSLASRVLERFGGRTVIHGHTAVASLTGVPPTGVHQAHVYAHGRCVAVDPGLYRGGAAFAHRLPKAADSG
jgi:hypothetical protein